MEIANPVASLFLQTGKLFYASAAFPGDSLYLECPLWSGLPFLVYLASIYFFFKTQLKPHFLWKTLQ